jgi:uncharacterized protein (DUF58 family)
MPPSGNRAVGRGSSGPTADVPFPTSQLFDPAFIAKLEALTLVTRRAMPGAAGGLRRALAPGASPEFADYRRYSPGDDFRRIDWNAYARLERLFLRLYRAEENARITIFLDGSASMGWGTPPKDRLARRLAGALAYIGLSNYDRVAIARCTTRVDHYLGPIAGQAAVRRVWQFLEDMPLGGETDLEAALRDFARFRPPPGLAVVVSDLLSPHGFAEGLKALLGLRQEVVLIQVLAAEELEPGLTGDWQLFDVESGGGVEITVTPRLLRAYRERLDALIAAADRFCARQGISFLQLRSDAPVEDVVLRMLRQSGVVR